MLALEMWLVVMIVALIVRTRRCLAVELSDAFMRSFLLLMARGILHKAGGSLVWLWVDIPMPDVPFS